MKLIIYKYPLSVAGTKEIQLPAYAKILSVAYDMKIYEPCLWVLLDPTAETITRKFEVVATGQEISVPINVEIEFIGTFHTPNSAFVGHVFEIISKNGFGLYARWRFKALTFNLALMMIEAQMFNLLLHRHWRKTRVTGWCGLVAQTFNYAQQ